MAEITAVGVYVHYWFPEIPQWVPALITLGLLYSANLITVKLFGEIEFWFALIKVVTIVAMIVLGLTIILFKFGDLGKTASFSNLWTQGGFAPFGALGVLLTLQMVMFGYQGLELIGVSAGETENPEKVLPHAIDSVAYCDPVYRRSADHHVSCRLEPIEPRDKPVRLGLREDRDSSWSRNYQLRRNHSRRIVVQQRDLQHRAHALQLGPGWAGSAPIR